MSAITIRDVPDETRNELATRAASSGRSLQSYLRNELIELANRPDNNAILQRIADRKRHTKSALTTKEILDHQDAERK